MCGLEPKVIDFGLAWEFDDLKIQNKLYCGTP